MLKLAAAAWAFITPAFACEIQLKRPVPLCPAVVYEPEDCEKTVWGKAGDRITHPATIHIMTSGRSNLCPSHEGCVELKDLRFIGCKFTFVDHKPGETDNYAAHLVVE